MAFEDFLSVHDRSATVLELERVAELRRRHLDRRKGKAVGPPIQLAPPPKAVPVGRTHLVIGDSHAHPDHPNWRYEWLGRLIVDRRPDVIVDIGDWFDLPSLFRFEKGRGRQFEGRRYWLDLEAGIDAMERVQYQIDLYNKGTPKRKQYNPRKIRVLGNHEQRIDKVIEWEPRFQEVIGYQDLMSAEFGWEQHKPGEPIEVDGISYVHYPFGTASWGGPVYLTANAIRSPRSIVASRSSVFGHSHRYDYHETVGPTGRIQSLNVGCYFDYLHDWLPASEQARWNAGLCLLTDVRAGAFDHEWLGLEAIRRRYG